MKRRYWNSRKFGTFLVLSIIITLSQGCTFRMSARSYDDFFNENNTPYTSHYYYWGNRKIYTVATGKKDVDVPSVVFFHGAPGSSSAFKKFLIHPELTSRFHLISVDRPGYGYSDYGKSVTSLDKESEMFGELLIHLTGGQPLILVGHSLGGAVVAKLAIDYPEMVDGIILISPSVDPALEPEEWFRKPLYSPFMRWMLPGSLRSTNDEIFMLKNELIKMAPHWKEIKAAVTVIHGEKDRLVDPQNITFVKSSLLNTEPTIELVEDANHFIPWKRPELIIKAIDEMTSMLISYQSK